jgi:hypothetical protein
MLKFGMILTPMKRISWHIKMIIICGAVLCGLAVGLIDVVKNARQRGTKLLSTLQQALSLKLKSG